MSDTPPWGDKRIDEMSDREQQRARALARPWWTWPGALLRGEL